MQLSWTFGSARSLVVDDNQENINVVRRLLEGTGSCTVEGVTDPTKAVEAYRRFRPDVILLDLHMPVMDGYEVLGHLKSAGAVRDFVPVLVCTADESAEARKRAPRMVNINLKGSDQCAAVDVNREGNVDHFPQHLI